MNDAKYILRYLGIPFYILIVQNSKLNCRDLCIVKGRFIVDYTGFYPNLLGNTILDLIYYYKTYFKE